MKDKESDQLFQRIRNDYFPQWDVENQWTVRHSNESNGACDRENKLLLLGNPTENYELDVLIIHEIAHAMTCDNSDNTHPDEWISEMQRVATEAETAGDDDLSRRLREHIEWVESGYDVEDDEIEEQIARAVRERPECSCEQIIELVAREYGQSSDILEGQFPRCRDWYEESKNMIESIKRRREQRANSPPLT